MSNPPTSADPVATGEAAAPLPPAPPPRPGRPSWRQLTALLLIMVLSGVVVAVAVARVRSHHHRSAAPAPAPNSSSSGSGTTNGPIDSSPVGSLPVPAGFPSATTTGVPAGVTLQPYTGTGTISQAGTVITGAQINACITITASNVTIKNSKIVCDQPKAAVSVPGAASNVVLTDDEIDGSGVATIGLGAKNTVATRLNIHGAGDGVHMGRDFTLQDSYVHDLARQPDIHHDDLQTIAGSNASNIKILHDTLQDKSANSNGNSVYHGGTGAISNLVMSGNYMDGGQYTIFIGNGDTQHGIVFQDNKFGRGYRFGVLSAGKGTAVTFTGNSWQDDGGSLSQATAQAAKSAGS